MNSGDCSRVLSLYGPSATLLPTFSSRTVDSEEGRRDYFEKLATREHLSVELRDKTVRSLSTGGGVDVVSGIYCFRFAVDGEILNFEARFSFVVNPALDRPILHHHSSQIPRQF